jgi:hypothetical protein
MAVTLASATDSHTHSLICLTPRAYGCDEKRYKAPIEA